MARVTRRIAAEYDERAVAALDAVLRDLRARRLWRWPGHGGSQEIDFRWYLLGGRVIRTRRETYFGLSITGPDRLVESLVTAVQAQIRVAAT
jgi:hypothetical protein